MTNDMSLKAKLRNIAKEKNISAQAILQNYLMNCFLYRLSSLNYDSKMLKEAFIATASHRESLEKISDSEGIIQVIAESLEMNKRWESYVRQMPYAKNITFLDTTCAVRNLLRICLER